jgi:beta-glucosidase
MRVAAASCWGVEELSPRDRVRKIIDAGCDQIGGEECPELVVELVRAGLVAEERIDQSVRRILREKFALGLFEAGPLDPAEAERIAGAAEHRRAGLAAQRRALTLLVNRDGILPIAERSRVYVEGIDRATASGYAQVVDGPGEAEVAVVRVPAPFEPRDGSFLERLFHAGDLDFKEPELGRLLGLLESVPTVVVISLDRPAVIPEIACAAAGLLADFGAADHAVLDVVFGRATPQGRLPFELPSSMAAVRAQKPDVPFDSERPLFPFGHGLSYA